MLRDRVPILISDGCDNLKATRNEDGTFRVSAFVVLKQNGEDIEAIVEIDRALIHIEALDNGKDVFRLLVPQDQDTAESFPEPSKDDFELLGFNESQAQMLTGRNHDESPEKDQDRNINGWL